MKFETKYAKHNIFKRLFEIMSGYGSPCISI